MIENFKKDGLTQKMMANFTGVSNSVICRYLSHNNILPFDDGSRKNLKYGLQVARSVVQNLYEAPKIAKKKHTFYNFKGGTGKTSLCYQVASHAALMGYKVLAIDADPQAHLSVSFCLTNHDNLTLYDLIINGHAHSSVIHNVFPGLDCIPSNLSLTRLEADLSNIPRREERLSLALNVLEQDYDFIFIDTNPTISVLNRNVINFVDVIEIVCETQPYSLNGLKLLMEDLSKFFYYMDTEKKQINIIPNKYEDRSSNAAEAMTVLKSFYSEYVKPDFAFRKSEDVINASKLCKPLAFFAKKNSIALEDTMELLRYIINISI